VCGGVCLSEEETHRYAAQPIAVATEAMLAIMTAAGRKDQDDSFKASRR
jgi:hypothetical protein